MCDRNCVSDAGRVPDLSASHGNEEGCLLDQLSWEGTWGPEAGTLAPTAPQRNGRAWGCHSSEMHTASQDLPQWLIPSGATAWGQWV